MSKFENPMVTEQSGEIEGKPEKKGPKMEKEKVIVEEDRAFSIDDKVIIEGEKKPKYFAGMTPDGKKAFVSTISSEKLAEGEEGGSTIRVDLDKIKKAE